MLKTIWSCNLSVIFLTLSNFQNHYLSFPALGCGVKEWNRGKAIEIAFETLKKVKLQSVTHVYFVFFDNVTFNTFKLIGEKKQLLSHEEVIEDGYRYQLKS